MSANYQPQDIFGHAHARGGGEMGVGLSERIFVYFLTFSGTFDLQIPFQMLRP